MAIAHGSQGPAPSQCGKDGAADQGAQVPAGETGGPPLPVPGWSGVWELWGHVTWSPCLGEESPQLSPGFQPLCPSLAQDPGSDKHC